MNRAAFFCSVMMVFSACCAQAEEVAAPPQQQLKWFPVPARSMGMQVKPAPPRPERAISRPLPPRAPDAAPPSADASPRGDLRANPILDIFGADTAH